MPTVTLQLRHLVRAVRAVAHVAGDSTGRPELDNVRLEAADGVLAVVATDRHMLAYARVDAAGELPPVYIPRHAAMSLLRTFEPCEHLREAENLPTDTYDATWPAGETILAVNVDDDGGYLRVHAPSLGDLSPLFGTATTEVKGARDVRGAVSAADYRPGVNPADPGVAGDTLGVNMRWLAEIYQAVGSPTPGAAWRITPGNRRQVIRVEYADWFIALVMPAVVPTGHLDFRLPYADRAAVA